MESITPNLILGDDIDRRLGWKPGRAERLARQRRLPHVILPDGSIRFDWDEIETLLVRVPKTGVRDE
jgi:hypothetical protein